MKIQKDRQDRQVVGLKKWQMAGYRGSLRWCTGSGKTYAAILAIKHLKRKKSDLFTVVAVPSDNLRTQWREQLEYHRLDKVYVDTVHTLVKSNITCDFFILDEIHSYTGGPVFSTLFDCVSRTYTLGLTAREREKPEDQAVLDTNAPIIDILDLKEALRNGWISEFQVYNLGVDLTVSDRRLYDKMHSEFIKYFSTFDFDFKLAMACLGNKNLRDDVSRRMNMPVKVVNAHVFQFNRIMQRRKKFLYNSEAVFCCARDIILTFPEKKIITFSETTDMADRLTAAIPESRAYHSNLKTTLIDGKKFGAKRLRIRYLSEFKDDTIRVLNSARALNEGTDIPSVDMSIKTSFTSTVLDSIQRLGRTLRKFGDKQATEINIYVKNTQSEKWLTKSQRETPNVSWIDSISEINA